MRQFARRCGYPLILKPRAAAGALGTERVAGDAELAAALAKVPFSEGASLAVEEYIEGHEGFYDTLSIDGVPVFEFVSHYYPNVLDAMRNRWITPYIVSTNRLDAASGYDELKAMGRKVIEVMELGTTATHMEWFYGPRGLKFSEIGSRPPGVGQWDVYADGNDIDIYREWASAIVHGRVERRPSRRFASGIIGDSRFYSPWLERWRQTPQGHFVAAMNNLIDRDDIQPRLGDIRCPAIVFHGTDDTGIPPSEGEHLHKTLPGSQRLVLVPGAAHAANLTHPEAVNPPLVEFLRALS